MLDYNNVTSGSSEEDYDTSEIIGLQVNTHEEYEDIIAEALWPNAVEQWLVILKILENSRKKPGRMALN